MRVLVTRPRDKAEQLARELERRGHAVLIEPLLTIERLLGGAPELEGVQAILLTSANAADALQGEILRLPLYAVGEATAEAARAAGARDVHVAAGNAVRLARLVASRCRPADGALLHFSGQEVREELATRLEAHGFEVRRRIIYRASPASAFSPEVASALRQGAIDVVLFFSPRTAGVFVELARRERLEDLLTGADAFCLSDAVAQACRALPWRRVTAAARPDQAALLALLEAGGRRC